MTALMMIAGIIILFVRSIIWYNSYNSKKNKAKLNKVEEQAKQALKNEIIKPLSYVEIKTKSGLKFETTPFKPYYKLEEDLDIHGFSVKKIYFYSIKSSKDQAKKFIKEWIKKDQFEDESTDTFIPMCEIESFKILSSDNTEWVREYL